MFMFIFFFALCSFLLTIPFRLFYFGIDTSARTLMIFPPSIVNSRCSIHGTFDKTKKWFPVLTRTVTFPPVLPVAVHLVMEIVIDGNFGSRLIINAVHVLVKGWPVSVMVVVPVQKV
jgi:hypothetical protein